VYVSGLSTRCCKTINILVITENNIYLPIDLFYYSDLPSSDVIMVTGSEGLEMPTPFSATILKWYVVAG